MATGKLRIRAKEGGSVVAVIGDEDTITGFLLAGVGDLGAKRNPNFLMVTNKTKPAEVEAAFKSFTSRDDVAIVLITQDVANEIRQLLDDYNALFPAVLEIPSKNTPYDITKDSLMVRVRRLQGLDNA
eukprot:TRINITY_DN492_c0_g1_i1.p1 TRINITY_DN492_c0_g1~~TRINITY_DN492_c0_g1_i1.p1  ORF type:complete len:128 (+),score=19.09 TRINITY_DN492_c0_g1_i1:24-407(+)